MREIAFELADAPLAVLDGNGLLVDANPAFCAAVGRPRDQVLGTPPDWLESREDATCEVSLPDGHRQRLRVARRPIGPDGKAGTVLTLERLGEAARLCPLAQTCSYPIILDTIGQGVCIHAADGRLVESNREAQRILGPYRDAGLGPACGLRRPDGSRLAAEDYPLAISLRTGQPVTDQVLRFEAEDGRLRWLRVDCRPIGQPGATPMVAATFVDVTELLEAQRRTVVTEQKFRAIFENTFEFIGLLSPDGRLLEANLTALSFIGRTELGDLAGLHFADTPWWEHSAADRAKLLQAISCAADGEFIRYETTHVDLNGGIAYVDFSLRPMRDDDGEVVFIIPEGRDITVRKRAEAALISAKLEAEAANRAKNEFLATVSHELRTPLNAVIGFSEAILIEAFGPVNAARYAEYLKLIHSAGLHLRSVIDDILDLARIELGRIELDEAECDPAPIIKTIVSLLEHKAAGQDIRLDCTLPTPLPALMADHRRLRQVVLNLLSNALKYTPPGGSIAIAADATDEGFEITVTDDGCGITPEVMASIWQPFQQVDPLIARKNGGAGLGLPIVKHFVEAHGGRITLACPPAGGTVARVLLPRERIVGRA
ncbi:MAG: PAS domain S-box protein [Magnetospirillum sp.]|nr:PAS domain S-box protein [Magnetospirillum sp.]